MNNVIAEIRAAEKNANDVKLQAEKEAEAIIAKAKRNGKDYIDNTVAAANVRAAELVKEAEETARVSVKMKIADAEKEAREILTIAESRMDSAILRIVERIADNI